MQPKHSVIRAEIFLKGPWTGQPDQSMLIYSAIDAIVNKVMLSTTTARCICDTTDQLQ